jgi:acyl transferase domain-containing protein/acyl carrier protein
MNIDATTTGMFDIAIVGMSGRFPQARDLDEFWRNLQRGVEAISFFSDTTLLEAGVDPNLLHDQQYVRAASVLADAECFDAAFFGVSPREAEILDPQQRVFLECAWEALESAGYNPQTYAGPIGVFAGVGLNTYLINNLLPSRGNHSTIDDFQLSITNDKDTLTTRVSYKLNLTGPSISVQTACSTSLVAVHLACQSLLNYQCDMALAGGVAIKFPQISGYRYQPGGIVSPDGHCRAFDALAQGTIVGNGAGLVVLKRLQDAIQDGDTIHAVIKGSAINNDGADKVGYTAPSVAGQAQVITEALAMAGVQPDAVSYIEAHGTGTALGDPIEIAALTKVFRAQTTKQGYCAIGSLKSNIGHLDAAAGVAGLIKTVLALKHRQIPPSLHFEQPNPRIDFEQSPFFVNTTLREWITDGTPRCAGVSAFGIGGTNAHVIVEEAPVPAQSRPSRPYQLLLLSAKTSGALEENTDRLAAHLRQHPDLDLADVAYTLAVGRQHFKHRRIVICQTSDDAITALEARDPKRVVTHVQEGEEPRVAFMFPGVGDQYAGMAAGLYQSEPVFRECIDRCAEFLKDRFGIDLYGTLYPSTSPTLQPTKDQGLDLHKLLGRNGPSSEPLHQTALAQPLVFVIEYALAQQMIAWGIQPQALVGYSLGEYVAACLAGVFSLEAALLLVTRRAQLIQQQPAGAMLAVSLPQQQAQGLLNQELSLAAINGPNVCVIAGPIAAIEALQQQLMRDGIASRRLQASHAFHSTMLLPLLDTFVDLMQTVELNPPTLPYISNVTGTWITSEQAQDPAYWARHMCEMVRFADDLETLLADPTLQILMEVGPGQSLASFVMQQPSWPHDNSRAVISTLRHEHNEQPDLAFALTAIGRLWLLGGSIDWGRWYAQEQRRRVPLPTYAFSRERYWIEPPRKPATSTKATTALAKTPDIADWFYRPFWRSTPLISLSAQQRARENSEPWLIFADDQGLGAQIFRRLKRDNQHVIQVQVGQQFVRLADDLYGINPESPDDYMLLVAALQARGQLPGILVHCWSVTALSDADGHIEQFDALQQWGFYSLLLLVQALEKHAVTKPLHMAVLSNATQSVIDGEALFPAKATLIGPCLVIPQEYPNITAAHIDLRMDELTTGNGKLLDALLAELVMPGPEKVIAYRNDQRWIQDFEAVPLPGYKQPPAVLRQNGVYMITGGLGRVGMALARHLAQTVNARLVLLGRSGLPPKAEWDAYRTAHGAEDLVSQRIAKVQQLEAAGSEVLVLGADVSDEKQMHAAINQIKERFGAIHGVIHAAGNVGGETFKPIAEIGYAEATRQFQPKVYGLYILEKVLRDEQLDFWLLASSLSPILGGIGFAAYAAANAFMDAFSHQLARRSSTRWLSVNWADWEPENLTLENDAYARVGTTLAGLIISTEEGIETFDRILSLQHQPQVIVSSGDLSARIRQWVRLESLQAPNSLAQPLPTTYRRPNLPTAYVAAESDLEYTIARIWQQVLGIHDIGIHDNFFDAGGNSLIALQLVAQMTKELQTPVSVVTLFEAPTISALAQKLSVNKPQSMARQQNKPSRRMHRGNARHDIAIVGMSCRFPNIRTIEEFWKILSEGQETITFFSDEELLAAGIAPELLQHPRYVKAMPMLPDVEKFDAAFFGYSPREAEILDPQLRVFLECAWEAIEQAGYDTEQYDGLIGVFAGASMSSYVANLYSNPEVAASLNGFQVGISLDKDSIPTTVAYKLNLKGPSITVSTFCSTSLVAVHVACQSLLNGECDMALAGGTTILLPQQTGYLAVEGGPDSLDGHIRAFDAKASGSVFGNGSGVVVLKPLAEALRDRDTIYAVIKGSAINNDGSLRAGFTAPSVDGQAQVIMAALDASGVDVETISYVEAHGSGTEIGDPIEVAALAKAYRQFTDKQGYCAIGSVKTNIGHTNAAAGIAGLIKTTLSLHHQAIPGSLHFETPNPEIDFEATPFFVNTALVPWKANGTPRRAGVTSLGLGGTNAHVILEEAPVQQFQPDSRSWQILVLSAKTASALETLTDNLHAHLEAHPELQLADVAYTLHVGRRAFRHCRTMICRDRVEALHILKTRPAQWIRTGLRSDEQPKVALLFPAALPRDVDVSRDLYQHEAVFRQQFDRCAALLKPVLGIDLHSVLYAEQPQAAAALLNEPATQIPIIFAIEYAIAQLYLTWGIQPNALLGYGPGAYVAACVAGICDLQDALHLAVALGRVLQSWPSVALLRVACSEQVLRSLLPDDSFSIVSDDELKHVMVAGQLEAIQILQDRLNERQIVWQPGTAADRSAADVLRPMLQPLTDTLQRVTLHPAQIPLLSATTGEPIMAAEGIDPGFWTQPVYHEITGSATPLVVAEHYRVVFSMGAVPINTALGPEPAGRVLPSLAASAHDSGSLPVLLQSLADALLAGVRVDWSRFYADEQRYRVPLPVYPFERQRYWIDQKPLVYDGATAQQPDTKASLDEWFYAPTWKRVRLARAHDHQASRRWLVFIDPDSSMHALIRRLEHVGNQVVCVNVGSHFQQAADNSYTINPRSPDDYDLLIKQLKATTGLPQAILHCWNVRPYRVESWDAELVDELQYRGFYSLLFLAQALNLPPGGTSIQLDVISSQLQEITSEESLCPEKATLLGACRVIPQEHPALQCRSIDIVLTDDGGLSAAMLDQLVMELATTSSERVVAYRGKHRWVQALDKIQLDPPAHPTSGLRPAGVYIITGGLGGIGLVLAEFLARAVTPKLALIGRSGLPSREAWDRIVADADSNSDAADKIRSVRALEAHGAEVLVLSADVADPAQMEAAIAQIRSRFGTIHGVIHAAGVPGGGVIQLKTAEVAEQVLQPKVHGTRILSTLLQDMPLDFLVLCSSGASLAGGVGQIDYCAANAFLDSFACYHSASSATPTIAINWDTWQNIGMAVNTKVPENMQMLREASFKVAIAPQEGTKVFHRVINSGLPQVLVSTQAWEIRLQQLSMLTAAVVEAHTEAMQTTKVKHPRPKLLAPYVAPDTEAEKTIARIWENILGIESIGVHDNFFDLGGHSLLATQLVSQLREVFQVELPLRAVFSSPNIEELAILIEDIILSQIEALP